MLLLWPCATLPGGSSNLRCYQSQQDAQSGAHIRYGVGSWLGPGLQAVPSHTRPRVKTLLCLTVGHRCLRARLLLSTQAIPIQFGPLEQLSLCDCESERASRPDIALHSSSSAHGRAMNVEDDRSVRCLWLNAVSTPRLKSCMHAPRQTTEVDVASKDAALDGTVTVT